MDSFDKLLADLEASLHEGHELALKNLKRLEAHRDEVKSTITAFELASLNRAIRAAKKTVKATEGA